MNGILLNQQQDVNINMTKDPNAGDGKKADIVNILTVGTRDPDRNYGEKTLTVGKNVGAQGENSFAVGYGVTAFGSQSVVSGSSNITRTDNSVILGGQTNYINGGSHNAILGGKGNKITQGMNNVILGGEGLIADSINQVVLGKYNKTNTGEIFIIGNGTSQTQPNNCFSINTEGKVTCNKISCPEIDGKLSQTLKKNIIENTIFTFTKPIAVGADTTELSFSGSTRTVDINTATDYDLETIEGVSLRDNIAAGFYRNLFTGYSMFKIKNLGGQTISLDSIADPGYHDQIEEAFCNQLSYGIEQAQARWTSADPLPKYYLTITMYIEEPAAKPSNNVFYCHEDSPTVSLQYSNDTSNHIIISRSPTEINTYENFFHVFFEMTPRINGVSTATRVLLDSTEIYLSENVKRWYKNTSQVNLTVQQAINNIYQMLGRLNIN